MDFEKSIWNIQICNCSTSCGPGRHNYVFIIKLWFCHYDGIPFNILLFGWCFLLKLQRFAISSALGLELASFSIKVTRYCTIQDHDDVPFDSFPSFLKFKLDILCSKLQLKIKLLTFLTESGKILFKLVSIALLFILPFFYYFPRIPNLTFTFLNHSFSVTY